MRQFFNRPTLTRVSVVAGSVVIGAVTYAAVHLRANQGQALDAQNPADQTSISLAIPSATTTLAKNDSAPSTQSQNPASSSDADSSFASGIEGRANRNDEASSTDELRRHIAQLQQTLSNQQATIASLQAAAADSAASRSQTNVPSTEHADDEDEDDNEPIGRRDPTTIYSRAEIDTAIAEVESMLGSAIAQGGFTSLDARRYRQLNRYLPSATASAFQERFTKALAAGSITKYD